MQKFTDTIAVRRADGLLRVMSDVSVAVYIAGTSTPAILYQDDETTTKPNPLTTDADGIVQAKIAPGIYDVVVSYGSTSQALPGYINFSSAGSYDPANVEITGGTINGVTIGNASPANATFNDLIVNGELNN